MVYRGTKDSKEYAYFVTIAQELEGINFIYTDTAEYIIGRSQLPRDRLTVHRGLESKDAFIFEGSTYQEMRDFILLEYNRGVVEESPQIDTLIRESHIPALRIVCHEIEDCTPYIKLLNDSNHHGHKLLKIYKVLTRKEHMSPNDTEVSATHKSSNSAHIEILDSRRGHLHHHPYRGNFTSDALEEFIEKYFTLRKHAHHYSEKVDDHSQTIVKRITGHNYEREVLHTKKHVVVLVHHGAPEEEMLKTSFENAAHWLHSKKIWKYVKFRFLNQKENLTPIPYHEKPVIILIKLHLQNRPDQFYTLELSSKKITKKMLYDLLKGKGSLYLRELQEHVDEIESDFEPDL